MLFRELALSGCFVVDVEPHHDDRGFFARTFCESEFRDQGLVARFAQSSISFSAHEGTVRGLHFQLEPYGETKLVRCLTGAVYDVVVDLRRDSPTYLKSQAVELNAENRSAIYIPRGVAHGFQTLADKSELLYLIDVPYEAAAASGVRFNDPAIAIKWPAPIAVISERDLAFPDWPV